MLPEESLTPGPDDARHGRPKEQFMRTRRRFGWTVLGVAVLVVLGGPASRGRADVMTPPGLRPGQPFRIVFVTNTLTPAISSSIGAYDAIVQADAAAGGLGNYQGSPVTWEVIGSTLTTVAVTRLPKDSVPLYLPTGVEVAASGADLWNTESISLSGGPSTPLLSPIDELANGSSAPPSFGVWTGTVSSGLGSANGSLGGFLPILGYGTSTDNTWVYGTVSPKVYSYPLYGFSSVLRVPQQAATISEPSSLALLALGGLGLAGWRRWRGRARATA
jgi:hypothetical protein